MCKNSSTHHCATATAYAARGAQWLYTTQRQRATAARSDAFANTKADKAVCTSTFWLSLPASSVLLHSATKILRMLLCTALCIAAGSREVGSMRRFARCLIVVLELMLSHLALHMWMIRVQFLNLRYMSRHLASKERNMLSCMC